MTQGSKVTDFPANKHKNAIQYCLPASRSEAIGNALETIGNVFGRNLNREVKKADVSEFTMWIDGKTIKGGLL